MARGFGGQEISMQFSVQTQGGRLTPALCRGRFTLSGEFLATNLSSMMIILDDLSNELNGVKRGLMWAIA